MEFLIELLNFNLNVKNFLNEDANLYIGTVSLTKEITLISLVQNKENAKLVSGFLWESVWIFMCVCLFVYCLLLYTSSKALDWTVFDGHGTQVPQGN